MREVVVGIISKKDKEGKDLYLLVSTKKDFGKYTGFYYPPGGHIENDEREEQALIREIDEELGVVVKPVSRLARLPNDIPNEVSCWWSCELISTDEHFVFKDGKVNAVAWLNEDEIRQREDIFPLTKKFFEEYIFKS